jgi:hypothetical protein
VQVKLTVTLALFQPLVFAAGAADAAIEGSVSSTFNVVFAVAVLPALSVAVPEITWFAPLAETNTGEGHCATPDSESEQVKFTVTLVLFHPEESGAGVPVAVIVGGVLSRLTLAQTETDLSPLLSIACPQMDWLAPSVVT